MKKANVFLVSCIVFSITILVFSREEQAGIIGYSQNAFFEKQQVQGDLTDPLTNATAKTSTSSTGKTGSTTR